MAPVCADDLTIVVPYRGDGGRRDALWTWVRARYGHFAAGAELVFRDCTDRVFSRSAAINNALGATRLRPYVLIADADHVLHEAWLDAALAAVRQDRVWCVPEVHCFLKRPKTDEWLATPATTAAERLPGFLPSDVDWWGYTGSSGLVLCRREAVFDARGFDERFNGWGLQDAGFAVALTTLGYERVKTHWCGHLFHPKHQAEPDGIGQEFANWDHFHRLEAADADELRRLVTEPDHDRGWWH
jgi:hypothetical protein